MVSLMCTIPLCCAIEYHDIFCLSDKILVGLVGGKRRNIILAKIVLLENADIFII